MIWIGNILLWAAVMFGLIACWPPRGCSNDIRIAYGLMVAVFAFAIAAVFDISFVAHA